MKRGVVLGMVVLAAGLTAGLSGLAFPTNTLPTGLPLVETKLSDWLLVWRHRWRPGSVKIDPRIQLVTLDESSVLYLAKPDAFWEKDYAAVTRGLLDAGAQVVALDIIQNVLTEKAPPPVKLLIDKSRDAMWDCLSEGHTVIAEHRMSDRTITWPERLVKAADDGRNSCLDNLMTDADGIVRTLPFGIGPGTGSPTVCSMSSRVAELAVNETMTRELGRWRFRGAVVPLENDALRVNYPGPSGSFPTVSLTALLHRIEGHDAFTEYAGKIVLIVPAFASDVHPTPFMLEDGHQMLGGEIHAAALNTMLTDQFLCPAPLALWIGLGSALAAAVTLMFATVNATLALPLAVGLDLGYVATCFALFCGRGQLMPLGTPLVGCLIGAGLGLFARFTTSDLARERTQRILGQMVSPQVASFLLASADEQPTPGGSRREITVLFSDINSFTPTCERLEPEQVMTMLNRYFTEMVAVIHAHQGYVKQFVGDEIMAIFGAPDPLDDHPSAAIACALAMMERLAQLKLADPTGENGFYSVKIGINTGSAVCGPVGSQERSEYAAVGDDVNLAARLESLTTSLGVSNLVSPATRERCLTLAEGWRWRSLGLQRFKGKTVELEVWTMERDER